MPNRAELAFQRYVRDLIRSFRQSLTPSLITYIPIGPLQPVLGKRKRRHYQHIGYRPRPYQYLMGGSDTKEQIRPAELNER